MQSSVCVWMFGGSVLKPTTASSDVKPQRLLTFRAFLFILFFRVRVCALTLKYLAVSFECLAPDGWSA